MYLLRLPAFGMNMESGTIRWVAAVGEWHELDASLLEVDTDKSTVDIEAKQPGRLARVLAANGEHVAVGTPLAVIAEEGEEPTDAAIEAFLAAELDTAVEPFEVRDPEPTIEQGAPPRKVERVRATPAARSLAAELGVDLASISATDPRGVVSRQDVEHALRAAGPRIRERRPVQGVVRAMAEAVSRSWSEIPQFVQTVHVNATNLQAHRDALAADGIRVSLTDLILYELAATAREVPEVNATFAGDEIIFYDDVNVTVAVSTERGLLVPVVKGVQDLDVATIGERLRDLAERARTGQLTPEDLADGTITLSNLGGQGVEFGTPIITPPQTALVFVGSILDRPAVDDGRVVSQPTLHLSIAFDHRVVDGAAGARFTVGLKRRLEAEAS